MNRRKSGYPLRHYCIALAGLTLLTTLAGCSSLGLTPKAMLADYFADLQVAIQRQEDPKLVEDGVPTLLLMIDGMLVSNPDDRELLRTACTTYSLYAQAFVSPDDDQQRSVVLFTRAREYGLRLLRQNSTYAAAEGKRFEEFEKAMLAFDKNDVPDLYAAANAWLGWILSQPDSMTAFAELPNTLALMKRVVELDEDYANGGAHIVFGIYYAVQPNGAGRDLGKSKKHFERAIELGGGNLLPRVTYAEFYMVAAADEEGYTQTLEKVIATNPGPVGKDNNALVNAIARKRAAKLLNKKEDYF